MSRTCIICKSLTNIVVFREFEIEILRCTACGHVFSSHHGDQDYDQYFGPQALASNDQFWWNEAHKQPYADFRERFLVGRSGRLLDVGCGLGYFVKSVSEVPSWEAYGYEISKPAVEFAQRRLRLDKVRHGRVEDSGFAQESFDIITLWDVIEHVPDPDPFLSYLFSILKPNGMLFIHTPNVQIQLPKAKLKRLIVGMKPRVHYLEAKDHLNIYSMNTIATVLHRNGFENIEFVHLRPIQSVSGSRSRLLAFAKNAWFYSGAALFWASRGRVNLDNLFVIARKASP